HLDDGPRRGSGGGCGRARGRGSTRGGGWRRGGGRRSLVRGREIELLLDQLGTGGSGRRRRGGRAARPSELALHELELGLVLGVGGLALHQDLEHGGGLPELALLDVGLGQLGVGGEEARLLGELLV